MKTITTLILIMLTCLGIKGQTAPDAGKPQPAGSVCQLKYAGTEWHIEHSDTARHQCQTIALAELPPMSQANTPMNLFINKMGTYSLKKSPELLISDEYSIVVEDLLTGQYYNLKSPEPYTFKMNRGFNQSRFILEISKSGSKVASAGK
jgi:hypothetical protein